MSTNFQRLQEATFSLADMWLQNFARNLPYILNGKSVKELNIFQNSIPKTDYVPHDSAIIIAKGPSVYKNNHLQILKSSSFDGTIICTDIMLINALKEGITPDKFPNYYVLTVDGDPEQSDFYDDPIVEKFHDKINVVLSTCTSPKVMDVCNKFGIEPFWFNPLMDDFRKEGSFSKIMNIMTKSKKNPKGVSSLQTGGNVGTNSWVLSWAILGCSPISLIGLDFGYPATTTIEETQHYEHLLKCFNNNVEKVKNEHKIIYNKDFDCDVLIDPIYDYYREGFCNLVTHTPNWVNTINSTEGGSLFGDRIQCKKFNDFLNQTNF